MAARDQVSSVATTTAAASVTITFPTNPATTSTVLVYGATYSTIGATAPVRDNGATATTYTQDQSSLTSSTHLYLHRAQGITMPATGGYTITWATTGSSFITAGAVAYSGVAAGAPTATATGGSTTAATALSAPAVTAPAGGSLYFAVVGSNFGGAQTWTLTSAGWVTAVNGTAQIPCASADIVSGTGAQTATWTVTGSAAWSSVSATYASTAAPPTDPGPPLTAAYVGPA